MEPIIKKNKEEEICENCFYYSKRDTSCHINPPTHDSWPFVKLNDWCGKWEDREY